MKNLLTNKWKISGAEKFDGSQWQKSENFVEGMCWEFQPKYSLSDKLIGTLIETTLEAEPETLAYSYNPQTQILEVEIYTAPEPSDYFDPQVDIYQLSILSQTKITLSILNEVGCPPPFFRYELTKL